MQLAHIQGPTESVNLGERVTFTEITPDATAWEWFFGESGKVDEHGKMASHVYRSTGYKTVTVYVTTPKGKLSGTATINVKVKQLDMPMPTIAPKDLAPAGGGGPTGVAKKNKFIADFTKFMTTADFNERVKLMDGFKKLVCNMGMEIKAKRKKKSLAEFCQMVIQDKDANEVKSLEVNFDDAQDCVSGLQVDYKGK